MDTGKNLKFFLNLLDIRVSCARNQKLFSGICRKYPVTTTNCNISSVYLDSFLGGSQPCFLEWLWLLRALTFRPVSYSFITVRLFE